MEDDENNKTNLETLRADRSVWLMKCPVVVAKSWQSIPPDSHHNLSKVVVSLDPLNPQDPSSLQVYMYIYMCSDKVFAYFSYRFDWLLKLGFMYCCNQWLVNYDLNIWFVKWGFFWILDDVQLKFWNPSFVDWLILLGIMEANFVYCFYGYSFCISVVRWKFMNDVVVQNQFSMEMAGSEMTPNMPKSYSLNMFKDFVPMTIFSESSQGKALALFMYFDFDSMSYPSSCGNINVDLAIWSGFLNYSSCSRINEFKCPRIFFNWTWHF